jgi:hypothetical protein
MHGNVIGLVTFYLVLRFILAGMNRVALELDRGSDHPRDSAADAAGFRTPTYMIALGEPSPRHLIRLLAVWA